MTLKDEIIKLRKKGYTYNQIKDELNCSKGTIAYHVGEGQVEKSKERSTRHKTNVRRKIWDLKEESGCVDCGEKYPHYMLDFDHLPGYEKVGSVTDIFANYSWEKGMEELKKCEIVCANCHRIRSYERNQQGHKER